MASVVAAPPPPSPASMSSRRVPLGSLPNAANSNYHGAAALPTKRPRSQSISQQRESNYVEKPVVKKQFVEAQPQAPPPQPPQPVPRTPVRNRADSKTMPPRRGTNRVRTVGGSPPPFNPISGPQQLQWRAGVGVDVAGVGAGTAGEGRVRTHASTVNANNTVGNAQDHGGTGETSDRIRAWQAHFRRMFPTFTFYFEGLPEESAVWYHRQAQGFGATVAKFFSNTVTHVITTKPIPPETTDTKQKPPSQSSQRGTAASSQYQSSRTNRNALFDKGTFNGQTHAKAEFTFKAPQGAKKYTALARQQDGHGRVVSYEESRTQQSYSQILLKSRELGIKIWALEKLQRMLHALIDGEQQQHAHHRGDHDAGNKAATAQDDHLSRLLRNERIHGPSDRDPDALSKDMVYFTGPFILVKDLKATHKPIMVREYERVAKREDGLWPQFRSTASGKCPFIDEQATLKDREREREARELKELKELERLKEMKKAQVAEEESVMQRAQGRMQPPAPRTVRHIEGGGSTTLARKPSRTLENLDPQDNRPDYGRGAGAGVGAGTAVPSRAQPSGVAAAAATSRTQPSGAARLFNVPSVVPAKRISNEMAFTSTNTGNSKNTTAYNSKYAYEPAASGVQPSNITSAIRSQMVSSHVDAPGAKTGMSRDMMELKRKATGNVVEIGRRSAIAGAAGIPRAAGARNLADLAGFKPEPKTALRKESGERIGKAVPIFQDVVEEQAVQARRSRQATAVEVKKAATATVKEAKPGYCENCREKFDDFDDHTMSRRHRKFACNENNFKDLDALLAKLQRPLRQRYINSH